MTMKLKNLTHLISLWINASSNRKKFWCRKNRAKFRPFRLRFPLKRPLCYSSVWPRGAQKLLWAQAAFGLSGCTEPQFPYKPHCKAGQQAGAKQHSLSLRRSQYLSKLVAWSFNSHSRHWLLKPSCYPHATSDAKPPAEWALDPRCVVSQTALPAPVRQKCPLERMKKRRGMWDFCLE